MKKLLSLLLAALLCMGCISPVLAETDLVSLFNNLNNTAATEEAFPYTVAEYQLYFDILCSSNLGVNPVWTNDGVNTVASIAGYGDAIIETNAEGYITKLSTTMTVSANDVTAANKLGMMIAIVALSSKATEDVTFITANSEAYTQELVNGLYALLGDLVAALSGPISSTAEVYGDTATFTLAIDMTDPANLMMTLGFIYEP